MEKKRRCILPFFIVLPFTFCSILGPRFIVKWPSSTFITLFSPTPEEDPIATSLSCDRTAYHSDVCTLQGDIRTDPFSSSIYLYTKSMTSANETEKIRPYPRKSDANLMSKIKELELSIINTSSGNHNCEIIYTVPAIVFSAGGFTGNVYHDFDDVLIPLYITSKKFNRKVIFIILEYRQWWVSKYSEVFSRLSAYPPLDFFQGNITHCFTHMTIGLHFHDDLAIDPMLTSPPNITIHDFHLLLDEAYRPRIQALDQEQGTSSTIELPKKEKPSIVIISRHGSRSIENETALVKLCEEVGFRVEVISPEVTMEMAKIYKALNSSDAMVGVIGCGLTHLLFQKPGDVFIQIVGLGTDWAAEISYGLPARKMGLKYIPYKIEPWESSLYRMYDKDDPVLMDPDKVAEKGWDVTKRLYLDQQKVMLDLERFSKPLKQAYEYIKARKEL